MSKKNSVQLMSFFFIFLLLHPALNGQELNHIYKAGDNGYHCFRIPSLITTAKGDLLAFAEARKQSCSDAGDIDLVVKRSKDNGKTWSSLQLVWSDSNNTCGNPAPVVVHELGHIILLSTWNLGEDHEKEIISGASKDTRRVYVMKSIDDGITWSTPREITQSVKMSNWTWYATGPGRGIQISRGKHKGRLVIPSNHIVAGSGLNYSHVIYSDDQGETWKLGGVTRQPGVNESTVAELSDGKLLLNMRNAGSSRFRQTAISKNGGRKWSSVSPDTALIEPVCEANMIHMKTANKTKLFFSNPASTKTRTHMTVRVSDDNGKTWPRKKLVYEGPSAYSCMTILANGNLGLLYECGKNRPYEGIAFEEIPLSTLQ